MSLRDDVIDIRKRVRKFRSDVVGTTAKTGDKQTASEAMLVGSIVAVMAAIEELLTDALEKDAGGG